MGTFNVTSSTLNNGYEYSNEYVTVNGNYTMDATNDTLQNVSGSVYKPAVVKYSISEMSRKDANKVWDAIDEIEQNILGTNNEEE